MLWRLLACITGVAAIVGTGFGAQSDSGRDAPLTAQESTQVRRVWVLSESDGFGYGSGSRSREIVVYDLVCEHRRSTGGWRHMQRKLAQSPLYALLGGLNPLQGIALARKPRFPQVLCSA